MLSRISALTLSDAEMHTYEGIDMENEVLPMAETTIKVSARRRTSHCTALISEQSTVDARGRRERCA